MHLKALGTVVKQAGGDWLDDNVTRLAAALAFYTLLSLAPLLILTISVGGLVFGEDAARGQLAHQMSGLLGDGGARAIEQVVAHAKTPSSGVIGTIVGVVVALVGASGVFGELQSSMNLVWGVAPKPGRGVVGFIRDRFFSFTLVLGVAFLLLVSLVLSAVLAALGAFFASSLPGGAALWQALNLVFSIGVSAALFAAIYKVLPDVEVRWRDVALGALATAVLFSIGKFAIGFYLGRSSVTSPFGAAGSVVALVVWIYYSAQILFFGAELTQAYARMHGAHIAPTPNAIAVPGK